MAGPARRRKHTAAALTAVAAAIAMLPLGAASAGAASAGAASAGTASAGAATGTRAAGAGAPPGVTGPTAPGAPGAPSYFDLARKDCVGTARDTRSKVWYTVADGVLSDVYEPTIDNTNVSTLQYI